jgi:hypothetical protein
MADRDWAALVLDTAYPQLDDRQDWRDVLGRTGAAGMPGRPWWTQRRLVTTVVLVAVLVALATAQAAMGGLPFISSGSPPAGNRSDQQLTRQQLLRRARARKLFAAHLATTPLVQGLPRHQITQNVYVPVTTPAKLAQVFGGPAGRYPARNLGVFYVRGPFQISRYLNGCQITPRVCPTPLGRWAWLAYLLLPPTGRGPMGDWAQAQWLRIAPIGTPPPPLGQLGVADPGVQPPPERAGLTAQLQGTLTVVIRRGSSLRAAPISCRFEKPRYTTPFCEALARYVTWRHVAHPNQTQPPPGDWVRISGNVGGWRGNLFITATSLRHAPPRLARRLGRALGALRAEPITSVPPPLACPFNPISCTHSINVTIHAITTLENHYGLDVRVVSAAAILSRARELYPTGDPITGVATNAHQVPAGKPYVLSITFARDLPRTLVFFERFRKLLGPTWGWFVYTNNLTLVHPFDSHAPDYPHSIGYAVLRDLGRLTTRR